LPGSSTVFSIGDDAGLEAASDLAELGLNITAVADTRGTGQDAYLVAALESHGIQFLRGYMASATAAGNGNSGKEIKRVTLSQVNGNASQTFECDLLAGSAGFTPVAGPLNTIGAKMVYDDHAGCFMPKGLPSGVHAAGRMLGLQAPDSLSASGRLAGILAAKDAGKDVSDTDIDSVKNQLKILPGPVQGSSPAFHPAIGKGRKSFVCFDEDGTVKSVRQSMEQGFDKPELVKRFGGFGLGPGQGGIPGHNLPLVMSQLQGLDNPDIAPTTTRSPLAPVLMATVAGTNPLIRKYTPLYSRQSLPGVEFIRTGAWMRANRMSDKKPLDADVADEVAAVRKGVGLLDVSTLGKFRVFGPDALKALQRVYISDMSRVGIGKLTYSAMLNTGGALVDDGVVTQLGEDDYYLTTSSAWAGEFETWIRYNTRYDNLDYHVVGLTDVLAAVNLAGPDSVKVLSRLAGSDIEKLPYMGFKESTLDVDGESVKAKVLRVGFLGERAYELHTTAASSEAVWDALMKAGASENIMAIGLEAQNICRMEKGHIILGLDSFQETNLLDLGLGFLWDRKDTINDKVGAPALKFADGKSGRTKLVGLEITDGCPGDGAILHDGDTIVGHICTARKSATLGKTVAMAVVKSPMNKPGTELGVFQDEGGTGDRGERRFTAKVVTMPFYDPKGLRLNDDTSAKGGE
ncbi:MAG: aminomethyltransferase family protein, partial [Desulfobacterales bacterium]|nr:aminomethyltransferase family protein [Desulfobacterales bacterium]